MHCDDAGIQWGTKSCGDTEEGHLNSLGWRLNEEEKLDERKVHFHLEGTKYHRGKDTVKHKWLAVVGSHLRVGKDGSLHAFLGVWVGVERGILAIVEDVTRCTKRDQLMRSFMCKPRV